MLGRIGVWDGGAGYTVRRPSFHVRLCGELDGLPFQERRAQFKLSEQMSIRSDRNGGLRARQLEGAFGGASIVALSCRRINSVS